MYMIVLGLVSLIFYAFVEFNRHGRRMVAYSGATSRTALAIGFALIAWGVFDIAWSYIAP